MYLFLVRHFNDIDHVTPVVWKMMREGHPVAVYCMNPRYDITGDYRLGFLKSQGVPVDYLHRRFGPKDDPFYKLLQRLINKYFGARKHADSRNRGFLTKSAAVMRGLAGFAGSLIYKITRSVYFNPGWARFILEQTGAKAVCFDYVMPKLYVVDSFLTAAKQMSIPTLSLPHGIQLYTNEVTKPKSTPTRRFAKFNRFDYIIAPNRLRKEILVKSGVTEEKIAVLGSARYCREWLEQNRKILPKVLDNHGCISSDRLKVVFMSSKPQARMDVARMIKSLEILSELEEIEVLIKPHTRTGRHKDLFDNIRLQKVSHVLTAEICEWADVMLVVGSSVITEALMRGKPALYLKYLHANTTLSEELGACWIIQDEKELKDALSALHTNGLQVPYEEKNVAKFIEEVVHGGSGDSDVLSRYLNFIVACASN